MTDSQEIILHDGRQFFVERVAVNPAAGEPMQSLRESLSGISIVSAGGGESFVYTATGPALRVFTGDAPAISNLH